VLKYDIHVALEFFICLQQGLFLFIASLIRLLEFGDGVNADDIFKLRLEVVAPAELIIVIEMGRFRNVARRIVPFPPSIV
jgi:hypothetical protein